MTSLTLRAVLRQRDGVEVGLHSYGSLLIPGHADRFTSIGRYTSVGPGVRRLGAAHPVDQASMHPYWYRHELGYVSAEADVPRTSCEIGNDVWIGADVVILPGCKRIGDGAVVGAGSIVTKDVADFTIVAGNPARLIRQRLTPAERDALKRDRPWLLPPDAYKDYLSVLSGDAGAAR